MPRNKRPMPNNDDRANPNRRKTAAYAFHKRSPAGAKLLTAAYKATHGMKPESPLEARQWYAQLEQPLWRAGESAKRIAEIKARTA